METMLLCVWGVLVSVAILYTLFKKPVMDDYDYRDIRQRLWDLENPRIFKDGQKVRVAGGLSKKPFIIEGSWVIKDCKGEYKRVYGYIGRRMGSSGVDEDRIIPVK